MKKKLVTFEEYCISKNKEYLLEEWDYERNEELGYTPQNISYGSQKKVWWKCKKGHERFISINNRKRTSSCLYCINIKVLKGENDLETTHPKTARRWHKVLNGKLTPNEITYSSSKTIWWKCSSCDKEYKRKPSLEIATNKCPICKVEYK